MFKALNPEKKQENSLLANQYNFHGANSRKLRKLRIKKQRMGKEMS